MQERPQRVLVVGITGAGKTTAARAVGERYDLPFHEMDALAIGPGWSTPAGFEARVAEIVRGPRWVFDSYGYEQVRDDMWAHVDTVVWLDYPGWIVAGRVLRRSVSRSWHRTPVFGGNVETWRSWLDADHPVWWAIRKMRERRRVVAALLARHPTVRTLRFRCPRHWQRWLADQQP